MRQLKIDALSALVVTDKWELGEAKFQSLMHQREGFHTCRRHVFHAQRQLCFHTAASSGIYILAIASISLSAPSRRSFSGDGSDKLPLHEQRYFLFTKRTEICKHWDTQGLRNIFPRNGSLLCDVHWLYRCLCSGNQSLRSMNYTGRAGVCKYHSCAVV